MRRTLSPALIKACGEVLRLEDWYFKDCPNDELRPCFYYEYLRESPLIRRLWIPWRDFVFSSADSPPAAQTRYSLVRKCLERRLSLQRRQFEKCLRIIRGPWPDRPWQDLPANERQGRCWDEEFEVRDTRKSPEETEIVHFAARVIPDASVEQIETLAKRLPDFALPERVFIVLIPEGANRKQVCDAFSLAVSKFSKKNKDYFEENEERQSGLRNKLRQLGVLRLRRLKDHCRSKDLKLTDELLVDYQRHSLRIAFKKDPENRRLSEDSLEEKVEESIPCRDPQYLGTCAKAAKKVLESLVVLPQKRRSTAYAVVPEGPALPVTPWDGEGRPNAVNGSL